MNPSDYNIIIGNATDVGMVRKENEDYLAHFDSPPGYCILICDGMGGHVGGQIASQTASVSIQQFLQDSQNGTSDIAETLVNAIEFANFQLRKMIKKESSLKGMGTTCVLALIKNGQLFTAHAGDSRIYLVRKKNIRQITKDHSAIQQLIDTGIISKEEAELSGGKSQINKAVGVFEKVSPTVTEKPIKLKNNDRILLCSDGLTDHVNEEQILETINSSEDVQKAALKLIKMANENGGNDNITVQIVQYSGQ